MGVLVITNDNDLKVLNVYATENWGHGWDMWKVLQGEGVRGRYFEDGTSFCCSSVPWYEKHRMALTTEWVSGEMVRATTKST